MERVPNWSMNRLLACILPGVCVAWSCHAGSTAGTSTAKSSRPDTVFSSRLSGPALEAFHVAASVALNPDPVCDTLTADLLDANQALATALSEIPTEQKERTHINFERLGNDVWASCAGEPSTRCGNEMSFPELRKATLAVLRSIDFNISEPGMLSATVDPLGEAVAPETLAARQVFVPTALAEFQNVHRDLNRIQLRFDPVRGSEPPKRQFRLAFFLACNPSASPDESRFSPEQSDPERTYCLWGAPDSGRTHNESGAPITEALSDWIKVWLDYTYEVPPSLPRGDMGTFTAERCFLQ